MPKFKNLRNESSESRPSQPHHVDMNGVPEEKFILLSKNGMRTSLHWDSPLMRSRDRLDRSKRKSLAKDYKSRATWQATHACFLYYFF